MTDSQGSKEESLSITPKSIEKFNSCIVWLETLNTEHTKKNFKLHLSLFCRFCNVDPDELAHWNNDQIKQKVLEYLVYLKKKAKHNPLKYSKDTTKKN